MRQFRWKIYLFIWLSLASFACKTILPTENTSTQYPTETANTTTQTPESGGTPLVTAIDWVMFFDSPDHWQYNITNDNNGNVYVFEKSIFDANSNDSLMLHLSKITNSGKKEWQIPLAETDYNSLDSFATDTSGNIYIASSSPKTWGDPIIPFVGKGHKGHDVYIAKIDENGKVLWNTFTGESWSSTISVDNQGNIYLMTFDRLDTAKKSNYNLIKLDSNGNILFDKPISGLKHVEPYYLFVHSDGNIYVSGEYVDYDGNLLGDLFLAKLANDGSLEWKVNIGGSESDEHGISHYGLITKVDQNGNAFVFGVSDSNWGNPVNPYDGGFITDDPNNIELSGDEYFIAKINNNGELLWNTFLNKSAHLYGTALDNNGNLFISGYSDSNWGEPVNPYNANNKNDGFIALVDTNTGSVTWNLFVGEEGEDLLLEMTIIDNNLYVRGITDKPFGNILNQNNNGGTFIAKITIQ